jgi:hypothetical protein
MSRAGVAPQAHRRGARVVRLADDSHLLPRDALQVLHHADRHPLGVEHRALLDVQLDERLRPVDTRRRLARVADSRELVAEPRAVDRHRVERLGQRQAAGIDQRAQHVGREARALLVGEEPDHQRPARPDRRGLQRRDRLQPGEHPVVAVVAPTGAHRVDVRPGHHGGQRFAPGVQPEHVADRVDGDRETELAHPADDEIAAAAVVVGEREPAATATVDRTDLRESVEPGEQPVSIDPQARPGGVVHAATSAASRPTTCR